MEESNNFKKYIKNFYNSLNGIQIAFKEHSFVSEIIGGFFLILYIVIFDLDYILKLIIFSVYLLLLAFELLNTAIEKLSDKISKEFDMDIKKIKDLSSAAVFVRLIILIILIIFSIFS